MSSSSASPSATPDDCIPLVRAPTKDACCFCAVITDMKNEASDIFCCSECSIDHIPEQLPSKIEWFEENLWTKMIDKGAAGPSFENYRFRNGKTFSEMLCQSMELPTYQFSPRWQTKQFYLEWLQDLAPGDQFFQHYGPNGENCGTFTVSRVTKNQIVSGQKKWSRHTGLLISNDNPKFKAQQITAKNLELLAKQHKERHKQD